MKQHNPVYRILSMVLLLATLAGSLMLPAVRSVRADSGIPAASSDDQAAQNDASDPDDSGSVDIRQQVVYYWHKGLPPQDGREYPVLLAWDDKYYMRVDGRMLSHLVDRCSKQYCSVNFGYSTPGFSNSEWFKNGAGSSPNGQYRIEVGYPTFEKNYLSDLDFDYNTLKSTGAAVSFSLPSVPFMKRLPKETPDPLSGIKEEDLADRVFIGVRPTAEMIADSGSNYFVADEVNWLTGFRYMDYRVFTSSFLGISYDSKQKMVFFWFLFPVNSLTYNRLSSLMPGGSFQNLKSGSSLTDFMEKNIDVMSWYVSSRSDSRVFSTVGFKTQVGRISNSFSEANRLKMLAEANPNLMLAHLGDIFSSIGNRMVVKYDKMSMHYAIDTPTIEKFDFDVYYAEPNLMYFLKNDIVVENGQTQNLDGPLVIEEGTKIIVKNGGVLSFTDWVVNHGEILVEPGGTMILQQNTTANGYTRNCAVISNNKDKTRAGRVACDGNIIIMPNCTLSGGGIYGIQLGEGAQVANYGQMVSEMWDIYTDYTIENRGGNESILYLGYSMNDTGFGLVPEGFHRIQDMNCLSNYQNALIKIPLNDWLYGDGSPLQYTNSKASVSRFENRKGRVTP